MVNVDAVPPLPVIPTINNITFPDTASLMTDPSTIGRGVVVDLPRSGSGFSIPRIRGTITDAGVVLERFITVLDDFDTENNYVLGGVTNGQATITVSPVVLDSSSETTANSFNSQSFTFSSEPEMDAMRDALANKQNLSIASAENPPSLMEFLAGGNTDLGVEMITSFLNANFTDGVLYNFAEGSLLAEITRSESGTLADVTQFRIRRFLERNVDNPELLALMAEPLAAYSKDFLNKDPATYTESERQFSTVLSLNMAKARDKFAERVEDRRDAWVANEVANGANMADLFGKDVPYKEFFTEGAAEYVTENIGAKVALTVGAGAAGGAATAAIMVGLTSTVLPFAVTTAAATGGATMGGSILTGASVASAGAAGVVAVPVAIVAGAVVGSVARGIMVFENVKQEGVYNDLVGSTGRPVTPAGFSLTTDSGNDDVINQTILLGACQRTCSSLNVLFYAHLFPNSFRSYRGPLAVGFAGGARCITLALRTKSARGHARSSPSIGGNTRDSPTRA